MRAIGMCQGQRGDCVLSTVAARAFKEKYPDSTLTLGINKKYADMAPLFANHSYFDDIHLYDNYSNWPSPLDKEYHIRAKYDIIYDPMPVRPNEATWWMTEHQAQNICSIYGLQTSNIQCNLTKWFDVPDNKGYIGFQWAGGMQDWPNKKSFSIDRANQIVQLIEKLGYKAMVFGATQEPELAYGTRFIGTYFDTIRNMLGCKMLVTVDTGLVWLASSYSFPTLGIYSNQYYLKNYVKNIQPINSNAVYLDDDLVNNIPLDIISHSLENMLNNL